MGFGDFAEKLGRLGIERDNLPEQVPEKPLLEVDKIPERLKAEITQVLSGLSEHSLDMPFLHITVKETIDEAGNKTPTGFVQSLWEDGLNRNTSGSVFVDRKPDQNWKEASPEYFKNHPELVVEDLRQAVLNFSHHGVRTNKKQLGFSGRKGSPEADYLASGRGVPILLVADPTGVSRRRGVDGIEHYITDERLPSGQVMGFLEVDSLDLSDPETVTGLTEDFVGLVQGYLKQQFGHDR